MESVQPNGQESHIPAAPMRIPFANRNASRTRRSRSVNVVAIKYSIALPPRSTPSHITFTITMM